MVKIIENYALHQQIGEGEYGKVFRGIDSRNKKEVAVKVINVKKFKQYPKLEECTLNEIEVLSKIECPHIVKFIEILKTANNFYFFYEYCNQGTLEDVIKSKGTLSEAQTLQYLSQILEAFQILTSKNIMHRDLKPSNILVSDGLIKIADFGFCKSLESHRDLAQTMLGSPIYMAPEVLKGQIYTIKADIWSLGVVVYEMLYGFCPYEERSIARLINLLDKEEVVFNPQINRISSDLEELLRKMLIKDHFKRICWKDIYQYKINGVPLLKSYYSNLERQEREREVEKPFVSEPCRTEQLIELKNFNNLNQRPVSRPSFDINFQDYSGTKPSTSNPLPQNPNLFKKHSQQSKQTSYQPLSTIPSPTSTTPIPSIPSISSTTIPTSISNKQNISISGPTTQPMSSKIRSRVAKNKIRYYLKIAAEVIDYNYCPELTVHLCLKIYQMLAKEIGKFDEQVITGQERQAISDAVKVFQEQSNRTPKTGISGPLLNHYIKSIQVSQKQSFQSTSLNKQLLIHCLSLLDLNDLSTKQKVGDYGNLGTSKLISELYQKIIRNVI